MQCVDQSDLAVYGKLGTSRGQSIFIDIVKCSNNDQVHCKLDTEIEEYFGGKFM